MFISGLITLQIIIIDINIIIPIRSIMLVLEAQGMHQFVSYCFNSHATSPLQIDHLPFLDSPDFAKTAESRADNLDVIFFSGSLHKLDAGFILNVSDPTGNNFTFFFI